ncbi:MAG: histidine kinase [Acidimicrobiia bacterium]
MTSTLERAGITTPAEATTIAPSGRRLVAVVLIVASVALGAWAALAATDADALGEHQQVVRLVLVAAWIVAGTALVVRRPDEPLGVLVLASTVTGAAATASAAALLGPDQGSGLEALRAVAVAALPALTLHGVLALPTGELIRRSHRACVVSGYALAAVAAVVIWIDRPAVPLWVPALQALVTVTVGGVASNTRYRQARGHERQRMQWFGWAATVAGEVALVAVALRLFLSWPRPLATVMTVATITVPASFLLSTSKRFLGRVDRMLAYTVSLTGLTGVVVAVYLVIVLGLGRVPDDEERGILLLSMVAAALTALLYLPTRARLTLFSNRLVYGEQRAPDEALRTFGSRLSRAIPLDELLLQLAESLRKSMALRAAEVWTGSGGVLERAVSAPDRGGAQLRLSDAEQPVVARAGVSGPAWLGVWLPRLLDGRDGAVLRVAPITHSGELLGMIVVERPEDEDAFSDDEESALAELARQLGLALHNVELDSALRESLAEVQRQAEELRASRARVVAAGDAERRKIERDLHDGAQQHLVALAVTVRLARQVADQDPEQAKAMLDELGQSLQEAVQELRNLAHGIYPPLLMDRGLPAALEAAAGRAALPTDVHAEGIDRFPQEVEAAVYFCCLEALQNAGKHAGEGAGATVTLRQEAEGLVFEVADTGAGFDMSSAQAKGHGFVNMSDRLGAIGGSVRVDSALGEGTRIRGTIPLAE